MARFTVECDNCDTELGRADSRDEAYAIAETHPDSHVVWVSSRRWFSGEKSDRADRV
jgi:hypothetical protein